jgi:TolB-like protein
LDMPKVSESVFLSYASEDATAAERIATALRSAGIDVWLDRSELRGGDAWDRQIREKIHDCRLFIPIISANTQRREEGYFRREWALAVDRTRDMAHHKTFLVPVVIDGTAARGASVPEKFHELQWTRLPAGETPSDFVQRLKGLLSPPNPHRTPAPQIGTTMPAAPVNGRTQSRHFKGVVPALSAAGLIALTYGGYRWGLPRIPLLGGAEAKSIAVLPLQNESADPTQQYFSDGLSEDLITALAHAPGLKVIGRASSFRFRDPQGDSRWIGEQLGVAHLIEGSVRRSGDTVRISAELINAADGSTMWSERYDRPYRDLFAVQDEITEAITKALKTQLLGGAQGTQGDRPPSGNLDAYSEYLQGRYFYNRDADQDSRQAIDHFTRATELDPRYAQAWGRLAQAWASLGYGWLGGAAAQEAYAKARIAAEAARALAPDAVTTHLAWGDIYSRIQFDQQAALASYERAVAMAPDDVDAKFLLATELASLGQLQRAEALQQDVFVLDPLQAQGFNQLALIQRGLNRLDQAAQAARKAIMLQPETAYFRWVLTTVEISRGNAKEALDAAEGVPSGLFRDISLAQARQIGTDRVAADAALKTLIDRWTSEAAYQIAQTYAIRRDTRKTFEWLDRAWDNRDGGIPYLLFDPFILRFRDDPRLATFCRKVGLPPPDTVVTQE